MSNEYDAFFAAVGANRARLALAFGPRPAPSAPLTPAYEFAAKARDRFLNVAFVDAWPMISELRQIKTTYEQTQMEKSGLISSNAHMAGMAAAKPGRFEYEVESAIEQVYMANGAMTWGYPSIVGSGPNATILHYNASNRQMQAGDILLVDAAGNYQGYTVDITRSYPISGSYTEAQKEHLPAGAGGAGSRHGRREDRQQDRRRREGRRGGREGRPAEAGPDHRRHAASSSAPGTPTASATGSAWTCTTSATTSGRWPPG